MPTTKKQPETSVMLMLATSDVHFLLEALEVHIAGLCEADESKENAESLSKAESIKEVLEESIEKL